MSKQKQKDKKIHVDATVHKTTVAGRIDAGGKVTTTAPKSAVYQGSAVVKQTADAVSTATTDLQTANGEVVTAEAALVVAQRGMRRSSRSTTPTMCSPRPSKRT